MLAYAALLALPCAFVGPAAFVSPFLPDNYKEAQVLTEVKLDGWNASQLHSGFITIDKATGSNTYFVFAPALSKRPDAPVLHRHPPHTHSRTRLTRADADPPVPETLPFSLHCPVCAPGAPLAAGRARRLFALRDVHGDWPLRH